MDTKHTCSLWMDSSAGNFRDEMGLYTHTHILTFLSTLCHAYILIYVNNLTCNYWVSKHLECLVHSWSPHSTSDHQERHPLRYCNITACCHVRCQVAACCQCCHIATWYHVICHVAGCSSPSVHTSPNTLLQCISFWPGYGKHHLYGGRTFHGSWVTECLVIIIIVVSQYTHYLSS